jgi:hypothetical protein
LIADNAEAIDLGFKKAFHHLPNYRIVCWAHAKRGHSNLIVEKYRAQIRANLVTLQIAPSSKIKIIKYFISILYFQ